MLYIAIVSHHHSSIIHELNCANRLSQLSNVQVIIKDNVGESSLEKYCRDNKIVYLCTPRGLGFGANNNCIFEYLKPKLNADDLFLVLNPDVYIANEEIIKLTTSMEKYNYIGATINLFKDEDYSIYDYSVRDFPTLRNFFESFVFKKNKTILPKEDIINDTSVDWCAGSFIIFRASAYSALGGFDERYFMYCEDIDICWRLKRDLGEKIMFMPGIRAIHYAQCQSRTIFSKHFYWHLKSSLMFLLSKSFYNTK